MNATQKIPLPIILIFGLLATNSVKATVVIGAEIGWQYIGNDSFKIIVHAYTDCNSSSSLSGTYITYFSPGDTCVPSPVVATESVCCGMDITPVCSKGCDRCSNSSCSFTYGIEEFTITATAYLPPECCFYTIAWSGISISRSSDITTEAASNGFYIESNLNRCIKPTLSSPYFSDPPMTIFCVNQCVVNNPGVIDQAVDSAGRPDSLSYKLVLPQSDYGTDISYYTPYSFDAPVIYAGTSKNQPFVPPYCYGFHLDSTNGTMEFKATKTDITVYVLAVDIYRRDSKGIERPVGEIKRDVEMIILKCPNDISPVIPGINGSSSYSINMCSGQQTCFDIKAFDLLPADTVTMTWNNPGTMNGATFTAIPNGQKWPTSIFCWSPKKSDVRSYPYTFVAKAIDKACPIPGRASKVFSIYVNSPAPTANYSATVQKCGLVDFQANLASNSPSAITGYLWIGDSAMGAKPLHIIGKTGFYQYNSPGTYRYTLSVTGAEGCTTIYKDSIIISKIPAIKLPKDTIVCTNSSLKVMAIPLDYIAPYSIKWSTGDTGKIINPTIGKNTILVAGIKDATGCTIYDTMRISTLNAPASQTLSSQVICIGDSALINASKVFGNTYLWTSIPSGFSSTSHDPIVTPTATTIYILRESNAIKCSTIDSVTITVKPLPNPHWTLDYFNKEAWFHAIDNAALGYQWIFGDGMIDSGNNVKHLYRHDSLYHVRLTITDSIGCKNNFDSAINIIYAGIEPGQSDNLQIEVFPNPFSSSTTVQYTLNKPSRISIYLYDITGRQITSLTKTILDKGSYQSEINAEKYHLNPGVYFIKFMTDDGLVSRQIVKL